MLATTNTGPRPEVTRPRPVRPAETNPAIGIRKVIIASITGNVPAEHHEDAIELLLETLESDDDEMRGLSIVAMYELDREHPLVLKAMVQSVADISVTVRRRAIRSLGNIGRNASYSLPWLIPAVHDWDMSVAMESVAAIGNFGDDGEAAIPALMGWLTHPELRVRTIVTTALSRIGGNVIPFAMAALKNPDPESRERAAALLGRLNACEDAVLEALLESMSDEDETVRMAAREALERLAAT